VPVFERTLDLSLLGPDLRPRTVSLLSPTAGRLVLRFTWNPRAHRKLTQTTTEDGLYFFSYQRDDGVVRIRGRAVTINGDMLASARAGDPTIAPGVLECTGPRDPGRYDLSDGTCKITYREEFEG
jgi:hypothetical protein